EATQRAVWPARSGSTNRPSPGRTLAVWLVLAKPRRGAVRKHARTSNHEGENKARREKRLALPRDGPKQGCAGRGAKARGCTKQLNSRSRIRSGQIGRSVSSETPAPGALRSTSLQTRWAMAGGPSTRSWVRRPRDPVTRPRPSPVRRPANERHLNL